MFLSSPRQLAVATLSSLIVVATMPLASAENTKGVSAKDVKIKAGSTVKVAGSLKKGAPIDLAWAAQSSVACFPATRFQHFDGSHVFFKAQLPKASVLKIKAVPKPGVDISLYAYSGPTTLPPAVTSVVSCEASYGTNQISQPFNPGEPEAVELNATTNSYDVIIGVAGAQKLAKGDFTLEFDLTTAAPAPTDKLSAATPIAAQSSKAVAVSGKIDEGKVIALAWAAQSNVACFPKTANEHFDGKHVVFSFDLPKYTTASVELIPKAPTLDLSLYGYSVGTTSTALPPDVPSVVSCEASYGTNSISNRFNPGGTETIELVAINNPYKVFVGVAGAQGAKQGAFDLKVTLKPR